MFLPFALPDIGDEEIAEVIDTLRSGWLTTGPKVRQFEAEFASFLGGAVEAVAVNSATAGLHLALEALGVRSGDEVITTTHTFTATAEVVRYLGAHPVFVDIDQHTMCMDAGQVESRITERTKVIMPVHFGGRAVDMKPLFELAERYGLQIVEDAAHALPATYHGNLVGTLQSDLTVFSSYANKTITTGEGGMLVTRDPELARRARTMRLHGISRDVFDRFTASKPSWQYEVVAPGFKYNMTDMAAALGIHQLRKAHLFREKREAIATRYNQAFAELPLTLPAASGGSDLHAWHLYVVRLDPSAEIDRDLFIARMFEREVGCSVHYVPLHLHPYWRDAYQLTPGMFPASQLAYLSSVSLPIYSRMTDCDINKVVEAVRAVLS